MWYELHWTNLLYFRSEIFCKDRNEHLVSKTRGNIPNIQVIINCWWKAQIHSWWGGLIKDRVCGNMFREGGRHLNFIEKYHLSSTNTEILAWQMCCFTGCSHHPHIWILIYTCLYVTHSVILNSISSKPCKGIWKNNLCFILPVWSTSVCA